MRPGYAFSAILLGLVGFAAVEAAGRAGGVLTAVTPYLPLDAAVYAVSTLLLALAFGRAFRRARAWSLPFLALAFILLFVPLAGVLAAAAELTADGLWGVPAMVRSAFVNTPLNLLFTLAIDVGFVALPLGVVSVTLLAWLARRAARR